MAQTPYELRFNYYMSARQHLTDEYHAMLSEVNLNYERGYGRAVFPVFPTHDKIIALAEEIKAFAEKK